MNDDELPFIDEASLVRYIRAALTLDGIDIAPELIERILMLEMEYLQHQGLAEHIIDDPRPEI